MKELYDVYEMSQDKMKDDIIVASGVELERALELVDEKPFLRTLVPCIINGA